MKLTTTADPWHPHTDQPKSEDFGPLGLIQIYDTQYKFVFTMTNSETRSFGYEVLTPMRPEWVWRRITPPEIKR